MAELGRDAKLRGEYEEALQLIDASLRLDYDQPRLHFDAVNLLHHALNAYPPNATVPDILEQDGDRRLDQYELQTAHVEAYLRSTRVGEISWRDDPRGNLEEGNFFGRLGGFSDIRLLPDRLRPRAQQLERARREMFFDVLEAKKRAGETAFVRQPSLVHSLLLGIADPEEDFRVRVRALHLYHDVAEDPNVIVDILTLGTHPDEWTGAAFGRRLDEVSKFGGEACLQAVKQLRAPRTAARVPAVSPGPGLATAPAAARNAAAPAPGPPAGRVTFTPLELSAVDENGEPVPIPNRFTDVVPCGPGIDLYVDLKDLYLMKERGILRRVYHSDEQFFNFSGVCFDGTFIWAPVKRPEPLLLVIDPIGVKVRTITAADGLPPTTAGVTAAPLAAGRALLAGVARKTWIADASLDADAGRATIDAFFEADEFHEDLDRRAWKNLHQAFAPEWMVALVSRDGSRTPPERRALVGRNGGHPLLVDPDRRTVEVLEDRIASAGLGEDFATREGTLYWAAPTGENSSEICRLGPPDLQRHVVRTDVPTRDGSIVLDEGALRMHVVKDRWYTAATIGGPFLILEGVVPYSWRPPKIVHSRHYGLLLLEGSDVGPMFSVHIDTRLPSTSQP